MRAHGETDDEMYTLPVALDTLGVLEPDVICLQEVLQKEGLPNQAVAIADSLGYRRTFASVDEPESPKRYGNAILVRHPLPTSGMRELEPLGDYRTAAHARIVVGGRALDVYCTHLHHTVEGGETRASQIRDLIDFVEQTRMRGAPILLAGDLNASPDAPEIDFLSDHFADAYAELHPEPDDRVTTLNPALGHTPRRLDYLLYDRDSSLQPIDVRIVFTEPTAEGTWASDHFGVVGRFVWPR